MLIYNNEVRAISQMTEVLKRKLVKYNTIQMKWHDDNF
jgi:hypothetical protein